MTTRIQFSLRTDVRLARHYNLAILAFLGEAITRGHYYSISVYTEADALCIDPHAFDNVGTQY